MRSIELSTGNENWVKSANMPTSPAIANGVIAFGSRDNYIFGLNATTGEQVWSISHGNNWVTGNALALDETFYIGTSDNAQFQAINATSGEVDWLVGSGKNVFSKASYANDAIYFSAGDAYSNTGSAGTGYIKSIDLNGNELWSLKGGNFISSPIVESQKLFIGGDDGHFYAISTEQ